MKWEKKNWTTKEEEYVNIQLTKVCKQKSATTKLHKEEYDKLKKGKRISNTKSHIYTHSLYTLTRNLYNGNHKKTRIKYKNIV